MKPFNPESPMSDVGPSKAKGLSLTGQLWHYTEVLSQKVNNPPLSPTP